MDTTSTSLKHTQSNAKLPIDKTAPIHIEIKLGKTSILKLYPHLPRSAAGIMNKSIRSNGFKILNLILVCFAIFIIFKVVVKVIHKPNPHINAFACINEEQQITNTKSTTPPKILLMKDLTSKLNAFKMLDVMLLKPSGIIIHAALLKNIPLNSLSKINFPISAPSPT